MAIVFGSSEAQAILEQDRKLAVLVGDGEVETLRKRLGNIEADIESVEEELSILYGERSFLQEQLVKKGAKI